MKVVTPQIMHQLEVLAYRQGFSEDDFMEKAGQGIAREAEQFITEFHLTKNILILCGKGNNGGDAFVAACLLLDWGYHVLALQVDEPSQCSPLCQQNRQRFLAKNGELTNQIEMTKKQPSLIIDGLFGTGFKGKIKEPCASLIDRVNQTGMPILAIDIPSGLNGETGQTDGAVIQATRTLFMELPKTGFFLGEGWNYTGTLRQIRFGLPAEIIESAPSEFELLTREQIASLIPSIKRNRHKYQAGHVVGLASSASMPGAGLLSSLAAFRGGSGMVRLLHPQEMESLLSASPYELIKIPYTYDQPLQILEWMQKAGATFVGPGLGRSESVGEMLQQLIPSLDKPCVLDADALFFYATLAFHLPAETLLTPHKGEMQKLLKISQPLDLTFELLRTCQTYAEEHRVTLVLKGAPTFIFQRDKPIMVNPTGNPGMATAGSGDVLTGLLASLLSQGLSCHAAALLGVYLHGLAGELAAYKSKTSIGMIAMDIINQIPAAYHLLQK